jgi:hypothetical protein
MKTPSKLPLSAQKFQNTENINTQTNKKTDFSKNKKSNPF